MAERQAEQIEQEKAKSSKSQEYGKRNNKPTIIQKETRICVGINII